MRTRRCGALWGAGGHYGTSWEWGEDTALWGAMGRYGTSWEWGEDTALWGAMGRYGALWYLMGVG